MKTTTSLLLLLGFAAGLSGTATAAPLLPDEPAAKEQTKKNVKAKQNRVPLFNFRKKKETEYAKAMRRNQLLTQPQEPAQPKE